jgi:hypothetical protein
MGSVVWCLLWVSGFGRREAVLGRGACRAAEACRRNRHDQVDAGPGRAVKFAFDM